MPDPVFTGPVLDNPVFSGDGSDIDSRRAAATQPGPGEGLKLGVPLNAAEDPSLQAALRRQGASASRARAEIARRQARLETGRDRAFEDFDTRLSRGNEDAGRSLELGLEQVDTAFEDRGLFRSGRRLRDRGRLGDEIERTRSRLEADVLRSRTRFQEDFDLDLEELARQRARIGSGGGRNRAALLEAARRRAISGQTNAGFVPTLFDEGRFSEFFPEPAATAPVRRTNNRPSFS